MPNLPGLNIPNQADYDRVVDAFNKSPAEYKTWYREALKEEVMRRERQARNQQLESEIKSITDSAT